MAIETELTAPETLSDDAKEGKIAFDFIEETANSLALNPAISGSHGSLARDFFNPYKQSEPRRYGTNVPVGRYTFHISPSGDVYLEGGQQRIRTALKISKYDNELIQQDNRKAFLGSVHAYTTWEEAEGEKKFIHGGVNIEDPKTELSDIEDIEEAIAWGRVLLSPLLKPISL